MNHFRRGSLSFVLLFAVACSDECLDDPTAHAFDEPGPWGDTPEEVFGHAEGSVLGTLTWIGPLTEGTLAPDLAETSVTLALTLDTSSAAGVRNSVGACDGELRIDATLSITTADGALDESIPLQLVAGPGSSQVSAIVDLSDYDFAGTLELSPGWTNQEMLLLLFWDRDTSMVGVMRTDEGPGVQTLEDPDAKSGMYAVIFANG